MASVPITPKAAEIDDHVKTAYYGFIEEFAKESDRAAVILGAAKLDILLYQMLKKFLRPCTSSTDELLDGEAGLGTFSSRINACHRLGLIDDHLTRALHLIRKIRNNFAHEIAGANLSSGAHRDRIRELVAPFKPYVAFGDWLKSKTFNHVSGPAAEFRACLAVIGARLEGYVERLKPFIREKPCVLVPESWIESDNKL